MTNKIKGVLAQQKPSSAYLLIAANLVPIYGVLFLDWNLFQILFLYWLESAVVGIYNIARMIKINPLASIPITPFFTIHYGGFMFVHLIFISTFAQYQTQELISNQPSLLFAAAMLFVSHGLSFFINFLGKKEYLQRDIREQMFIPYKRIVVMHLTILFGAFLSLAIGQPIVFLLLLIGLKIAIDYYAHVREHLITPNAPVSNKRKVK